MYDVTSTWLLFLEPFDFVAFYFRECHGPVVPCYWCFVFNLTCGHFGGPCLFRCDIRDRMLHSGHFRSLQVVSIRQTEIAPIECQFPPLNKMTSLSLEFTLLTSRDVRLRLTHGLDPIGFLSPDPLRLSSALRIRRVGFSSLFICSQATTIRPSFAVQHELDSGVQTGRSLVVRTLEIEGARV